VSFGVAGDNRVVVLHEIVQNRLSDVGALRQESWSKSVDVESGERLRFGQFNVHRHEVHVFQSLTGEKVVHDRGHLRLTITG
jgi:hypothetical protein